MEAPEKIYIHVKKDKITNTWNSTWVGVHDVEYTRTDVSIKKAVDYIANNMRCDGYTLQTKVKFIKDFKKYMEE